MKWHEEALDTAGHRAAARLAGSLPRTFYLAGGTALALRLGHRISLDLDFFSKDNRLGRAERTSLLGGLSSSGRLEILESKDGTLHLRLEGTAISLFYYPYRLLGHAETWKGLRIASLEDIAAMKISAAVGRGSRKDFMDLHYLCRLIRLEVALNAALRKFPDHPDFDLQAAKALVFFEDAEKEPLPRLLLELSWDQVKSYFEAEVSRYLRRRLGPGKSR
jgi:predicted nucleotidyltransferase component of viral defense system